MSDMNSLTGDMRYTVQIHKYDKLCFVHF